MARVPQDDHRLEMEEIEGLIAVHRAGGGGGATSSVASSSSGVGGGGRRRGGGGSGGPSPAGALLGRLSSDVTNATTARNRRWALAVLLVAVVVILFTADSDEVAELEELKMIDVEEKERLRQRPHPASENVVDDLPPDVEPVRLPELPSDPGDGDGDGTKPDGETKGEDEAEREGAKHDDGGTGPEGRGGDETASEGAAATTKPDEDDETKPDGPKQGEGTEGDAGGGGGEGGGDSDSHATKTDETTKVDDTTKAAAGAYEQPEPNDEGTTSPTASKTTRPTASPTAAHKADEETKAGAYEQEQNEEGTTSPSSSKTTRPTASPTASPTAAAGTKSLTTGEVDEEEEAKKKRIKEELTAKWGHWHFWDGAADVRPKEDYCAEHPHRDVPEQDFPERSWQVDAVYVNHYLNDAVDLVHRAEEAIYAEYGHGKPLEVEELVERSKMFKLEELDLGTATGPSEGWREGGGWTTRRSFDGLVRRLLHAMMTNDSFTVVVAGDGDAAGRGNHFKQSYAMEFHRIMKPIFDRLRVNLVTRNVARDDDFGVLPNALGSASVHGDEVDVLVWDGSDDDEEAGDSKRDLDLFARQAILGGNRVPILFGGDFDVLKILHERGDVDVGTLGTGRRGVPETIDDDQAENLPWAARYVKCAAGKEALCQNPDAKFRNACWIERPDVKPPTTQRERVEVGEKKGQGTTRPGFRDHVLKARVLAMSVLQALQYGLNQWSEITINAGHPLPDEYWHVTGYYGNIRQKVRSLGPDVGFCDRVEGLLPTRICSTPLKSRTESTPRANPDETSLRSIVKPTADGRVPNIRESMLYDGPDVPNPNLFELPEDAIDVFAIVGNRRRRKLAGTDSKNFSDRRTFGATVDDLRPRTRDARRTKEEDDGSIVQTGKGWEIVGVPPGNCDGTYDAICGRVGSSDCLLDGRMDAVGGLVGDERSGWLAMNVPAGLSEGLLMIRLETTDATALPDASEGMDEGKGGGRILRLRHISDGVAPSSSGLERRRRLETPPSSELPDGFSFEYAVNGDVAALDRARFSERKKVLRPGVEVLTLLDESDFAKDGEGGPKDVELAIRMTGCGRDCAFKLTHVYWA